MTINLKDYEDGIKEATPAVRAVLEGTFAEAARMIPAGLRNFMEGGKGLCNLDRSSDLEISLLTGNAAGGQGSRGKHYP